MSETPITDARTEKLAEFLFELGYGYGAWSSLDARDDDDSDRIESYRDDAREIMERYPHLRPLTERDDLPKHEWGNAVFTGNRTCAKCGLLPLDEDDYSLPCKKGNRA